MKQKFFKILKIAFKNLLAFIVGVVFSVAMTLLFAKQLLEPIFEKDIGLGIIAVAPIMLFIYLIMFGIAGGTFAVIIYNVIRFIKWRREKRNVVEGVGVK